MKNQFSSEPLDGASLVGLVLAGRYQLTRMVTDGANTMIFDGDDTDKGRRVTVKIVHPERSADDSFADAFESEMRRVSAMSHPNIVAVYDWGWHEIGDRSVAYVVVEHLTGGSLRDLFDRGRRLSASQALVVGLDVCRGLDYAHRRGFVHTELSPSKLLFGDDRRPRIVDFGLARLLSEPGWATPESVPNHVAVYSAPEQGQGEAPTAATDIYSLCLVLQEAVTGSVPFSSDSTVSTLSARVGKLMPVSADLGSMATVLERAGRPEPDERPTAAQLGKALIEAASKLSRPEPLPLLSSAVFNTPDDQLRSPDDPTGGVIRPESDLEPLVVVPVDAPDEMPGTTPSLESESPVPEASESDAPAPVEPNPPAETVGVPDEPVRTVAPTETMAAIPTVVEVPDEPSRRRSVPWWMIAGIGLILVAGIVVLIAHSLRTPVHEVPDLSGITEAQAQNLASPYSWEIVVVTERSDEVPDVGLVVETRPGAGLQLAEGETLILVISEGPVLREIPKTIALPYDDVAKYLTEQGLDPRRVDEYDEEVAEGIVISWSAPADPTLSVGSMVEPGTIIELTVSLGPEPRTVPDLVGESFNDAERTLKDMKLEIRETGREFSDDYDLDEIITQSVEAGEEVDRGTTIEVVVSKGPDLVVFPDLSSYVSYVDAEPALREAGFVPKLVTGDAESPIFEAKIDGEVAVAGEKYRRGSDVEIVAVEAP
ncbi:MAG: hypothetical protein CSA55_01355 [Ilumatobacter coccineus]|uniref:non-specific serine/threonine protein kinase n=1 Tax=Ilumatobacter coccineus TaxID=467094 RepID=A0A2G6KEP9_9ACTN|nr:MAG: hypothetical protein CSA55_01355 [Ilumatobacter coccineus]